MSASENEKPTPRVPRSRKSATARTSQHAETSAHACHARRSEVVRGLSQRPSREAQCTPACCQARHRHDQRGGSEPGDSHDPEPCAYTDPGTRKGNADGGKWRQCGAVDQPQHDEREAERTHAGRTAWIAADYGDPHRVVEATRKDDSDQCCAAVGSGERKRLGPLVRRE